MPLHPIADIRSARDVMPVVPSVAMQWLGEGLPMAVTMGEQSFNDLE